MKMKKFLAILKTVSMFTFKQIVVPVLVAVLAAIILAHFGMGV